MKTSKQVNNENIHLTISAAVSPGKTGQLPSVSCVFGVLVSVSVFTESKNELWAEIQYRTSEMFTIINSI